VTVTWDRACIGKDVAVHQPPQGAAFDIVLLLHVACVVVGLVTVVTEAATATRLRRLLPSNGPLPEPVRRYFRPGFNWAARAVYGIPVFGFALLAMSQGAYSLGQGWVLAGLAIFVTVALLGEGVIWPAERRIAGVLAEPDGTAGDAVDAASVSESDAVALARSARLALALLLVGIVIMIAQP
jgi:uncharacterized membrane protein